MCRYIFTILSSSWGHCSSSAYSTHFHWDYTDYTLFSSQNPSGLRELWGPHIAGGGCSFTTSFRISFNGLLSRSAGSSMHHILSALASNRPLAIITGYKWINKCLSSGLWQPSNLHHRLNSHTVWPHFNLSKYWNWLLNSQILHSIFHTLC